MENTENKENEIYDILWKLDLVSEEIVENDDLKETSLAEELILVENVPLLEKDSIIEINTSESETNTSCEIKKEINTISESKNKFKSFSLFIFKYVLTSSLIFGLLLVTTNYSSYMTVVKSYIFSEELKNNNDMLVNSVKASYIQEDMKNRNKNWLTKSELEEVENSTEKLTSHSIKSLVKKNDDDIKLKIDITPYENRIVIPKIWKNIPLIDIENKSVAWEKELNHIFMEELEKWVIRYPWSVKPWLIWNTFIFWHSSNFPWIKWDYNSIFALLDNVTYDDNVIIYYNQKKYVYKIREKKVISPWDVSVLKRNKNKSELTLMTCWPIWTTFNRLIVTWDLLDENWVVINWSWTIAPTITNPTSTSTGNVIKQQKTVLLKK